jgi:hypothetical protein
MIEKNDIINLVESFGSRSMSDFQARYFVVNSQVTDYKRIHQAILEVDSRIASKKQIERNKKKTEIQKKIVERDIINEPDSLKRELLEIDLDQLDYDISVYDKRYRVCLEELDIFVSILQDLVPNFEKLQSYKDHNEEEERYYWVLRMGKQAALDLSTIGRVGQGNMDSIAMMPLQDQEKALGVAMTYNKLLDRGMQTIEKQVNVDLILPPNNMTYIDGIFERNYLLK